MGGMLENGREVKEREAICIHTAYSQSFRTETNTTLQRKYTPIKEESQVECSLASMFLWVSGDVSSFPRQSISPRSFLCSYSGTISLSFLPSTQVVPFMSWWRSQLNPWRWLYSSLAFFFILQSLHNYILLSFQRLWFWFAKTFGESKCPNLDHFLCGCFWI